MTLTFPAPHTSLTSLFQGTRRSRRIAAITSIILLIALVPIVYPARPEQRRRERSRRAALTLRDPQKTETAWPSDNWAYRQIITVTNNGSAQTNYLMAVFFDRMEIV